MKMKQSFVPVSMHCPPDAHHNLCCLPSQPMRADGSLIYGLRAPAWKSYRSCLLLLVCDAGEKLCSENCWPLGCPAQGLSNLISGLHLTACEAWYIVSTQLTLAVIIIIIDFVIIIFTLLLLFSFRSLWKHPNRAPAWMYLMCVCAAFNHPSFNSPKGSFHEWSVIKTNYIFMISICTFIYEPIVSGTV